MKLKVNWNFFASSCSSSYSSSTVGCFEGEQVDDLELHVASELFVYIYPPQTYTHIHTKEEFLKINFLSKIDLLFCVKDVSQLLEYKSNIARMHHEGNPFNC